MAPLYGVMAPMAGKLGMEQGKFIGWLNQVIGQTTNESLGDLPFSTCFFFFFLGGGVSYLHNNASLVLHENFS